jgi:hypothetical protein
LKPWRFFSDLDILIGRIKLKTENLKRTENSKNITTDVRFIFLHRHSNTIIGHEVYSTVSIEFKKEITGTQQRLLKCM